MDALALLLSRLQFAFTISFHIIFPSFSIGLAAWLTVLEALNLATGRPAYRVVFDFWLKIFGIAFGLGVVSGIVMAFQFGTNWNVLARMVGSIQGVLLSYETFTAFALEASFFGVLVFGRSRVPPWFYLFSTGMVALGTTLSAFWIMGNNSWMQVPVGYSLENGVFVPTDWAAIIFSPVLWVRFPHMLFAAYLTGAFCVAATGAWYCCAMNTMPKRASCCTWASVLQLCWFRFSCCSDIWWAITSTIISRQSLLPSRHAGTTNNRPAKL
jgi:cytochrome bd ubiquinol oxidase subunit I